MSGKRRDRERAENKQPKFLAPQVAVQQTSQGQIVWVVNDAGVAEARPVKTGDWVDDGWVVETGLDGGEQVVVEGFQRLRPGTAVKTRPYDRDAAARTPAGDGKTAAADGDQEG